MTDILETEIPERVTELVPWLRAHFPVLPLRDPQPAAIAAALRLGGQVDLIEFIQHKLDERDKQDFS